MYIYNLFINVYKIVAKQIKFFIANTTKEIYIILNSKIKLLFELKVNCHQNNLLPIDKVAIIILKKYN